MAIFNTTDIMDAVTDAETSPMGGYGNTPNNVQQNAANQLIGKIANPYQAGINQANSNHYSAYGIDPSKHLGPADASGFRPINEDGYKQIQSTIPDNSGLIGQIKNITPPPDLSMLGMLKLPPPMSPKQAGTLANAAGMTGVGSALGGSEAGGGIMGILGALL
jgi:hypothetical protein